MYRPIFIELNREDRRRAKKLKLTPLEYYNLKWGTKYTEAEVQQSKDFFDPSKSTAGPNMNKEEE